MEYSSLASPKDLVTLASMEGQPFVPSEQPAASLTDGSEHITLNDSTSLSSRKCVFMELPLEVRVMIYLYIFDKTEDDIPNCSITIVPDRTRSKGGKKSASSHAYRYTLINHRRYPDYRIFLASKEIQTEILGTIKNRLEFDCSKLPATEAAFRRAYDSVLKDKKYLFAFGKVRSERRKKKKPEAGKATTQQALMVLDEQMTTSIEANADVEANGVTEANADVEPNNDVEADADAAGSANVEGNADVEANVSASAGTRTSKGPVPNKLAERLLQLAAQDKTNEQKIITIQVEPISSNRDRNKFHSVYAQRLRPWVSETVIRFGALFMWKIANVCAQNNFQQLKSGVVVGGIHQLRLKFLLEYYRPDVYTALGTSPPPEHVRTGQWLEINYHHYTDNPKAQPRVFGYGNDQSVSTHEVETGEVYLAHLLLDDDVDEYVDEWMDEEYLLEQYFDGESPVWESAILITHSK